MNLRKSLLTLLIITTGLVLSAQTYKIDVEISDLSDKDIYLGYYYGNKTYVKDTIRLDSKGKGSFKGDSLLDQGLYIIVMPDKNYFDVIIGEDQVFSIETKLVNLISNLKIKGSDENQALIDFQGHMQSQNKKIVTKQVRLKEQTEGSDSIKIYQEELQQLSDNIKIFWDKTIEDNNGNVLSILVNAMKNPEIPDYEVPEEIVNKDSARWFHSYNYNRTHYFDFIDFTDKRFLRTPIFHNKVETFFSRVIIQDPDTITNYIDVILVDAEKDAEMFEYLLRYFLSTYSKSDIMGMDKVVLNVVEKYYLSGKADWMDEESLEKMRTQIAKLRFNQIGNTAQDLKLETIHEEYARLHEIKAKYTLVYFWEPHCGHCKKTTPKVADLYHEYSRDEFEVFAVYTQTDKKEWTDYVFDKGYDEWINVWDRYNLTNFRFFYNINSTPSLYLLDENKKIVAKRISIETIKEILDIEFGKTSVKDKIEQENLKKD
jgi:thiol-disulfide isomerase/thioredoxin